ncbi:UNVERIFIED_CONTAM: hypothetical protein ABID98_002783 [Brevibacillus sp. OAP136]
MKSVQNLEKKLALLSFAVSFILLLSLLAKLIRS